MAVRFRPAPPLFGGSDHFRWQRDSFRWGCICSDGVSRDLSVVWFSQRVGDVTVTRGVLVMAKTPTPDQTARVSGIMPRVHRLCVDKTGMGLPIFETMDRLFPGKVEGIIFTQQTKEMMATKAKRHLEETRCRLPNDPAIWQSFRSVRKTTTALGQVRFDAARQYDHADFWWAFCLW
jgi:phage FluMu gp28-like protein